MATGENERFGFFTTEDLVDVEEPRSSSLVTEIPLAEATETERTVTLSAGDTEEEFDVYEVDVDGEMQDLLLAYRGSKNLFVDPEDRSIQTYAVERTAPRAEDVAFQWNNYEAFFDLGLNRALVNTTLVTLLVVLGQVVTSVFGGYAFSRIRFRGRDGLFLAYLGSIMIPFVVLIIPMYRLMVILDWQNALASLISALGLYGLRHLFDETVFHLYTQRFRRGRRAGRGESLAYPLADFCAFEHTRHRHARHLPRFCMPGTAFCGRCSSSTKPTRPTTSSRWRLSSSAISRRIGPTLC